MKPLSTAEGHVLLIDDEELVREIVTEALESVGFAVTVFENGIDAVDWFRSNGASVDVVILDLAMPVMSGAAVFQALREIDPKAKVLISSGSMAGAEAQELVDQGAVGILVKPFTIGELAENVRRATDAG